MGANLAAALARDGHDVMGHDLMEPETPCWEALGRPPPGVYDTGWIELPGLVHRCLEMYKPDVVVHLAARSTVEVAFANPVPAFETNVMGTVQVLEACRALGIPAVIASSDKAYGASRAPFHEETTHFKPKFPYDVSKACADMIAISYAQTYKAKITVTRSCNVYGPGDLHWNRLVPRSFRELANGRRPILYGPMENIRREWMHIDDLVEAYRVLIDKIVTNPDAVSGLAVNIGTGVVCTLRDMMRRILIAAGKGGSEPIVATAEFEELGDEWLSHARLERLGWAPKVALDDGLSRTWEWYRDYVWPHRNERAYVPSVASGA